MTNKIENINDKSVKELLEMWISHEKLNLRGADLEGVYTIKLEISDISNSYWSLNAKAENNKFYWWIENYDWNIDYKEISWKLWNELLKY